MNRRTITYVSGRTSPPPATHERLRQAVVDRGDTVVGAVAEHPSPCAGKSRQAGWKSLRANLDGVDLIAVPTAADLPGKSVKDLLAILGQLRDRGVDLLLVAEGIDTGAGPAFVLLDLITAYRRAKLSAAIRAGQAKCGKKIGRPAVPAVVRARIESALAGGAGVRPTARRFGVSPSTVLNIRAAMAQIDAEAA